MNEPTKPRYFRLLEKGEIIERGDLYYESEKWKPYNLAIGSHLASSLPPSFRPVQVDEWIPYAERKPTKEDFEPTGAVQIVRNNGEPIHVQPKWLERKELRPATDAYNVDFWRKVTPPEQPKPKSVTLDIRTEGGNLREQRTLTPLADGKVKLDCGDVIASESIDEFIKARESVMEK